MRVSIVFILAVCPAIAVAQSAKPANGKRILLWPDGAPGAKGKTDRDRPSITVYAPPKAKRNGCAVVVCPGGGYGGLAVSYEGRDVARWFNTFGVTGFVLRYRHAPHYRHPAPLQDVQRAIRLVRQRATTFGVDPQRIGVMGFSAGGHLASSAGTHFDAGKKDAKDPADRVSCRPDYLVLVYPVISMTTQYTHKGSRRNLLGPNPGEKLKKLMSSELQVTKDTPPTFLMHTSGDKPVPAENSVLFYLALRKAGVPVEMHIYERGRHGLRAGEEGPDTVVMAGPIA